MASSGRALQRDPSLRIELGVHTATQPRQVAVSGQDSRSDFFEEVGSTTILLTDDLEDQGAFGSVVLSPALNLQGAGLEPVWNRVARCF